MSEQDKYIDLYRARSKDDFNKGNAPLTDRTGFEIQQVGQGSVDDLRASIRNLRRSGNLGDEDYQTITTIISRTISAWRTGIYYEPLMESVRVAWNEAAEPQVDKK